MVGVWAFLGIFLLIVLSRSAYRIIAPTHINGDAYDNLLQIQDMREAGHRRPSRPGSVVTSGVYTYPHFVLWVLSFLPDRILLNVERYFSAISDIVMAGILLVLIRLQFLTVDQTFIALVVFLLTPQFLRPDLPNGVGLSQRKPGVIFATCRLLMFVVWTVNGADWAFALAVLLGAVMVLTSKFSLQAYTFICVSLAVFVSPGALGLLILSVTSALLLSRGDYARILRGHLKHLYDYATVKQYKRFDHRFPDPVGWVKALWSTRSTEELLELVYENRFSMAVLNAPFIIGVIGAYGFAVVEGSGLRLGVPLAIHVWVGTSILCFVLISLPHLLFIGLAERYLEYGLLPGVIIIAHAWSQFSVYYEYLIIGVCFVGVSTISVYIWGFRNVFFPEERDRAIDGLVSHLNQYEPGVVLCHPAFIAREIAWKTDHRIVDRIGGNSQSTDAASKEINRLFPTKYDFVTDDIEWLADTYDIDWVVYDLEKLREESPTGRYSDAIGLPLPAADPTYENDKFKLYRFSTLFDEYHPA